MKRPWLLPLVPLYWVGMALGRRKARRLQGRVVSVGSLSAGGAGKSPVVMMLAGMLQEAGFAVDVLSRGYGRGGRGVERVDVEGSAAWYGDEPMVMARRLGVPVWVGADRYAAGVAAEVGAGEVVHVLDDGFQHRRLARDADVVLLTREDVEDGLLPAGNLREGLGALRRAAVVVLREDEADWLRRYVPEGKATWVVRRRLVIRGEVPGRALVFCGIARPGGLLAMLAAAGGTGAEMVRFPDHHAYGMRDMTRLTAAAVRCGATSFCTTEKDAVKLTDTMRRRLEKFGPVVVAELSVELVEGSLGDLGLGWGATEDPPTLGENAQSLPFIGLKGRSPAAGKVKS